MLGIAVLPNSSLCCEWFVSVPAAVVAAALIGKLDCCTGSRVPAAAKGPIRLADRATSALRWSLAPAMMTLAFCGNALLWLVVDIGTGVTAVLRTPVWRLRGACMKKPEAAAVAAVRGAPL